MGEPELRHLLATVARRYYLEDCSKVQIGQELGLSRFKVARLLQEAREVGVVRIEIEPQVGVDEELASAVRERLGLRRVVVVDLRADSPAREYTRGLAHAAAETLTQALSAGDVLGLASSRSVAAMLAELTALPPVPVVQLCGALQLADGGTTSIDLVRDAARLSGGKAHQFFAPLITGDASSASAMRREPGVADALTLASEVTTAVVGVGAWLPHESTLFEHSSQAERAELADADVVGEICGVFMRSTGDPLSLGISERIITLSAQQLQGIDHVIGLAAGAARSEIVRAAAAGGFLNSLVCDRPVATAVLKA